LGARSHSEAHAATQADLQLHQLQSVQELSNLVDQGRQKLQASRVVLNQTPAASKAATPAATAAATGADSTAAVDLIQPPQLQPLALPSYGPQMQIDELADIQREQLSLRQKKLMVAQQKRVIQESEDNESKLQQLIDVNKQIEQKNEQALVAANQHLTDRIKAYGDRLAQESGTGGSSGVSADDASGAALLESDESSTDLKQAAEEHNSADTQMMQQMQAQIKSQNENIQRLQEMLVNRKRRHRHRRGKNSGKDDDNETTNDNGNQANIKPVTA